MFPAIIAAIASAMANTGKGSENGGASYDYGKPAEGIKQETQGLQESQSMQTPQTSSPVGNNEGVK